MAEPPSPKLQLYAFKVALVAVEPEPSKLTVIGAGPVAAEEEMTAVGGVAGVIGALAAVTATVAVLVWPTLSVSVSRAV